MPKDKYEDEIRDILNRMDDFIPEGSPRPRRRPPRPSPWSNRLTNLRRQLNSWNSTSLMASCVILALVAGLMQRIYPPFGAMAALASVACLLGAIALPMLSGRYGTGERRWRGKVIDYEPAQIRRPFSWRYVWWRIKNFFGLR